MIKNKCFQDDWLDGFKNQKRYNKIDKTILEKMIYALHLVEQLKLNGLDFTFKGGTSLLLLLKEGNRFSIDIDIISNADRDELEKILNRVIDSSRFTSCKLDETRSYQPGVPKAHYKFLFQSQKRGSGTILLDILLEESIYPEHTKIPVQTQWIETDRDTLIKVPTIDAITGDKLTAFAPNTTGIPYFKGKDRQSFSMEICKQLFDLSKLFEHIKKMEVVATSFQKFAEKEINYRKNEDPKSELSPEKVLNDVIETGLILANRGKGSNEEQKNFRELQNGIKAFGTGFLMTGKFRIDEAISAAAKVSYLAAKILSADYSRIEYYDGKKIDDLLIEDKAWNVLNRLKRLPDKSAFFYWYQTVELLKTIQVGKR